MSETYPSSFWGSSSTRSSLIRRLSNLDDHEAWADFVARYAEPIHRIARAKGLSKTDAEDLVQQVLIRVARAMPSYRRVERDGAFRRWLGTLSRWCVTDQWRSAKREEAKRVRLERVTKHQGTAYIRDGLFPLPEQKTGLTPSEMCGFFILL